MVKKIIMSNLFKWNVENFKNSKGLYMGNVFVIGIDFDYRVPFYFFFSLKILTEFPFLNFLNKDNII